jgi:hypothetical protein
MQVSLTHGWRQNLQNPSFNWLGGQITHIQPAFIFWQFCRRPFYIRNGAFFANQQNPSFHWLYANTFAKRRHTLNISCICRPMQQFHPPITFFSIFAEE